ncbi:FAD-dependent oxidoreductase [Nocardia takedensis]|uniref:FAD-dependent oxidoreductase n=2 Tax=Nocardia takedensis TaxID=259390 RepID=UPI00278BD76B|nr:FAD-dependent oxidoreductase [Nocardia takedensis]
MAIAMNPSTGEVERCAVCIVGAGVAGLNALAVAGEYLSRDQKVVLIERRPRAGGMWIDTYPYVRLHQPYRFFTVGDLGWDLDTKPSYLATKDEVLVHLTRCLDVLSRRVQLVTRFGEEFESDTETGGYVRITTRSADGTTRVIEAERLIKAYGCQIVPNEPLPLSSARINSVSPDYHDLRKGALKNSDTPVWVIGGGKTAMDTAQLLIAEYPGREINLVTGSGTYFMRRDRMFPEGIRKWWAGNEPISLFSRLANRFDGANEEEMVALFRDNYCTRLTPDASNFLFSYLSDAESATIAAGLTTTVLERLVDAVDRGEITELVFRDGSTRPVPHGSWVVNCTGYLLARQHSYEPYASASGAVLSIQQRSATLQPVTVQSYFMTHLMFLDRLRDAPLYELDVEELRRKANRVLPYALMALNQHNFSVIADSVPMKAFLDCGADVSRWFPLPRRLVNAAQFLRTHRRDRDHHRRTLETVRERFDVRCGRLAAS